MKEVIISPRGPGQNGFVERLIGSIRRECLNHVVAVNQRHLRQLKSYFAYDHAPERTWPWPRTLPKGGRSCRKGRSSPFHRSANRSAIVLKPKQPFLDWLRAADPTGREHTLFDLTREPRIYLVTEWDTDEDRAELLHEFSEEIFDEQLAGWYRDPSTWPQDRSYDVFCHWFDYQHHSRLFNL